MTWLTWRQYRFQLYIAAALLAAFTTVILITGEQIAARFHTAAAACAKGGVGCVRYGGLFMGSHVTGFMVLATLGAPVLFGLFWGAPLVASEVEAGTLQFAWTQGVTRRHWLTVKAGVLMLAAALWGGAISALVTWWYGPANAYEPNQFSPGRFDLAGIVPVGYAVFAMALGICAGVLLRRTLPAMAATLAGFVVVRVAVALWLRPHYMAAVTKTYHVLAGYQPAGAFWQLATGVRTASGGPVAPPQGLVQNGSYLDGIPVSDLPSSCRSAAAAAGPGPAHLPASCQAALETFRGYLTYQPGDRYWAFQGMEFGLYLVLAAALVAVAARVLLRRDA